MSEKKQEITGYEGEAGSFIVVDGKRQPNPDAAPVTLTPDDQGYPEAKKLAEAQAKAAHEAAKAKAQPAASSSAVTPKGGK